MGVKTNDSLDHKSKVRDYTVKLSELDITIILEALGHKESRAPSKCNRILIERFYRAMGVRL